MKYLIVLAAVFAINLLPAFGPPTWAVLVVAHWQWALSPVALVALGAVGAASGRYLLAIAARSLRERFPARYRANLASVEARLAQRRGRIAALFGLFVLSPLPSAQMFLGAGLLDLRIGLLIGAFMLGRIVTYSLYLGAAVAADHTFHSVLDQAWGSTWSVVLQLALVVAVAALPALPWSRWLARSRD